MTTSPIKQRKGGVRNSPSSTLEYSKAASEFSEKEPLAKDVGMVSVIIHICPSS